MNGSGYRWVGKKGTLVGGKSLKLFTGTDWWVTSEMPMPYNLPDGRPCSLQTTPFPRGSIQDGGMPLTACSAPLCQWDFLPWVDSPLALGTSMLLGRRKPYHCAQALQHCVERLGMPPRVQCAMQHGTFKGVWYPWCCLDRDGTMWRLHCWDLPMTDPECYPQTLEEEANTPRWWTRAPRGSGGYYLSPWMSRNLEPEEPAKSDPTL